MENTKKQNSMWSAPVIIAAVVSALLLLAVLAFSLVSRTGYFDRKNVAMTVGEEPISVLEFQYNYANAVNAFYSEYYDYLSYLSVDFTKDLDAQEYAEGQTWEDYFVSETRRDLEEVTMLYLEAKNSGYTLTAEDEALITETIDELKAVADSYGSSFGEYLKLYYGGPVNENDLKEYVTRRYIASKYYEQYVAGLEYTDEEMETYYGEHKDAIDVITYRSFTVKVDTPATEEETAALTDEEVAALDAAAKAKAEAMAAVTSEAEYIAMTLENALDSERETYVNENATLNKTLLANVSNTELATWLGEDRKAGDTVVLNGTDGYDVIYYVGRGRLEGTTASFRHLFKSVSETTAEDGTVTSNKEEAKTAIETLYNDWKAGEATEDALVALITENSDDTTAEGLYANVGPGDLYTALDTWLYADGRQAGDSEVVESELGYHIMYFIGYGDLQWKVSVKSLMQSEDYEAFNASLAEKYPVEVDYTQLDKVSL